MATTKLYPTQSKENYTSIPINIEIKKRIGKWDRIDTLLTQDEEKIRTGFCRRLPNEKNNAYTERKKTFLDTFVNPTQDLITAPINSVFNQGYNLEYEKEDQSVIKLFNKNVTNENTDYPIGRYLKEIVGLQLRAYGNVCIIVDKPSIDATSRENELNNGMPYLNTIRMQDVINWQVDANGDFDWFVYKKKYCPPWGNPFSDDQPVNMDLECMYTKNEYVVRETGGNLVPELSYSHNWGFVPIIFQGSFVLFQNNMVGNAAMFQTSYSIINMNNCLNVGNYELYKHGGALLLMPEEARTQFNTETESNGDVNTKRYDSGGVMDYAGDVAPSYLVKDLRASEFMDWARYYMNATIDNERDLRSVVKLGANGSGVAESGISKMVERDPIKANLAALACDIETVYGKIATMVAKIMATNDDSTLEFDRDYDYRTLDQKYDELKKALDSKIEEVSPTLFKEHYRNIAPDVTNDQEVIDAVNEEISDYEYKIVSDEIDDEIKKELNIVDNDKQM